MKRVENNNKKLCKKHKVHKQTIGHDPQSKSVKIKVSSLTRRISFIAKISIVDDVPIMLMKINAKCLRIAFLMFSLNYFSYFSGVAYIVA